MQYIPRVEGHGLLIFLFSLYCDGGCVFYSLKFCRGPNKVLDDQLFHNQFCNVFSQTTVTRWL